MNPEGSFGEDKALGQFEDLWIRWDDGIEGRIQTHYLDVDLLRGAPAHSDRTDHRSPVNQGEITLKWCRPGQGQRRDPPLTDLVLKDLARRPEDRGSAGLANGDLGARHLGVIETLEQQ